MRRNDLPPPGAATDVAASSHHHQNVPHPPPVLWVEGQSAPTSYRDGLRKPISAPPRLPGPIYGVPGFGCSGQLQIGNELPMTLPIQPFSTSGTVFERQLTAVDRQLTAVDRQLTGVDRQLTGVDRQLTGVDRQLTGVDRSPVPTAARVPHAVTPVAEPRPPPVTTLAVGHAHTTYGPPPTATSDPAGLWPAVVRFLQAYPQYQLARTAPSSTEVPAVGNIHGLPSLGLPNHLPLAELCNPVHGEVMPPSLSTLTILPASTTLLTERAIEPVPDLLLARTDCVAGSGIEPRLSSGTVQEGIVSQL